ncbi:MAG: hypothetical protein QM759_16150 [Terricaulis sp.]
MSAHKLQRLHRWILLWLRWFAAFLDAAEAFAPFTEVVVELAHRRLDHIQRGLFSIVVLRAHARHRRRLLRPRHSPYRCNETHLRRAILGSAFRRRFRVRDLRARIEALSQDIDVLVNRLLRRLPCGLTRRRAIMPCPEARVREAQSVSGVCVCAADTS